MRNGQGSPNGFGMFMLIIVAFTLMLLGYGTTMMRGAAWEVGRSTIRGMHRW